MGNSFEILRKIITQGTSFNADAFWIFIVTVGLKIEASQEIIYFFKYERKLEVLDTRDIIDNIYDIDISLP